jgi:hypothetical protein
VKKDENSVRSILNKYMDENYSVDDVIRPYAILEKFPEFKGKNISSYIHNWKREKKARMAKEDALAARNKINEIEKELDKKDKELENNNENKEKYTLEVDFSSKLTINFIKSEIYKDIVSCIDPDLKIKWVNLGTRILDIENRISPTAGQFYPVQSIEETISTNLMQDIDKVKAVISKFGGNIKVNDAINFMKEMNELNSTTEESIRKSLKNEDTNELSNIILKRKYNFNKTRESTFDRNELESLYQESDL